MSRRHGDEASRVISTVFQIFETLVDEGLGIIFPYSSDNSAHSVWIIMKLFFLTDKKSIIKRGYF